MSQKKTRSQRRAKRKQRELYEAHCINNQTSNIVSDMDRELVEALDVLSGVVLMEETALLHQRLERLMPFNPSEDGTEELSPKEWAEKYLK